MGGCIGGALIYKDPNIKLLKPQFDALRLKPTEVSRLYNIFQKVDTDGSGSIGLKELMMHIDLNENRFSRRIFSIFDEDSSGQIDFREFVLAVWNYCTLSKPTLAVFAFDLYDTDSTGSLSPPEIGGMLVDLYGAEATTNPQAKIISAELLSQELEFSIDVERFSRFVDQHPALLFPAFQIQHALREKIMGTTFWASAAQRRVKLCDGKYVPVAVLTTLNVDQQLYATYAHPAEPGSHSSGAQFILENTGTYHFRNQQAKLFSSLSRRRLYSGGAPKFNVAVKTKEERLVEERIDPMDRLYKDIIGKANTKVISAAEGGRRLSTKTSKRVVPEDGSHRRAEGEGGGSSKGGANASLRRATVSGAPSSASSTVPLPALTVSISPSSSASPSPSTGHSANSKRDKRRASDVTPTHAAPGGNGKSPSVTPSSHRHPSSATASNSPVDARPAASGNPGRHRAGHSK